MLFNITVNKTCYLGYILFQLCMVLRKLNNSKPKSIFWVKINSTKLKIQNFNKYNLRFELYNLFYIHLKCVLNNKNAA